MTKVSHYYCKPAWLSIESYGLILILISALLFSVMGVFLKLASETGMPSTQLVFFRAIFQGSFVVIGMLVCRQRDNGCLLILNPFGQSSRQAKVVISRGAVGGIGFILYFYSIKALPFGDAVTLFSLYPIVTIFLARCMLDEPIMCTKLIAAFACAVGATLIAGPSFLLQRDGNDTMVQTSTYNPLGYFTALLGSFFGALVVVLIRMAGKIGVHTLQLLFSWCVFGMLFSILVGMSTVGKELEGAWQFPQSTVHWLYILGMCSMGSIAHFLFNYAIKLGPAGLSAITKSSDIVWAYMWEVIIFHQVPTSSTLIGVTFILLALAWTALLKVNEERKGILPKIATDNGKEIVTETTVLLKPERF